MLLESPRLSVVVVSRGRVTALDSLAALSKQEGTDHEIVLIEHGGDSLRGAAMQYQARYAVMPADASLGAVRQAGVDLATGDIIAFTDDDCVPAPTWLAAIARAARAHPGAHGIQGRTDGEPGPADTYTVQVTAPDRLYRTCNIAYRREAIESAGGFDPGFRRWFEDTDLGIRVAATGPIVFEPAARIRHLAMPRSPLDVGDWRTLLADEGRLREKHPSYYRQARGRGVRTVVAMRWGLGSAAKALARGLPDSRAHPRAFWRLIELLARERWALVRALIRGAVRPD